MIKKLILLFALLAPSLACAAVTATQPLSLPIYSQLVITTKTLPGVEEGTFFSDTLDVAGGLQPYTWSVSAGALPPGVTLTSGGMLSGIIPKGTCTPPGCTYNFTVSVTDSSGAKAAIQIGRPKANTKTGPRQ